MARKPGLPRKYAKMGFARGWRAFKAALKKRGKKVKRTIVKKITARPKRKRRIVAKRRSNPHNPGGNPVARKKKYIVRMKTNPMVKEFVDGGTIAGSAVGSSMLMNMVPMLRNLNPWVRGLMLALPGAVIVGTARNRTMKAIGKGAVTGGMLTLILPFIPETQKVFGGRRLTAGEMDMIKRTLGVPINIANNKAMGLPIDITSQTMGAGNNSNYSYAKNY